MLSEFCGAEFLKKYVEISLGNDLIDTKIIEDTFIRWVFPYDIIYWVKNLSNPFIFFKTNNSTCYINFTYSTLFRSLFFVCFTYFRFSKLTNLFGSGK